MKREKGRKRKSARKREEKSEENPACKIRRPEESFRGNTGNGMRYLVLEIESRKAPPKGAAVGRNSVTRKLGKKEKKSEKCLRIPMTKLRPREVFQRLNVLNH